MTPSHQDYTDRRPIGALVRGSHSRSAFGRLDIELTERCNNNCVHCYINLPEGDPDARQKELTTGEWKEILSQAADLGLLTIRFTGGEPLLRHDFADLYRFTRRLGMRVVISTNGRLITPDITRLLLEIPPMEPIEVTSYGRYERSYEAVTRVRGSYGEFMEGIRLLSEGGIPFHIRGVRLPGNKEDIPALNRWAREVSGQNDDPPYTILLDLRTRRDSPGRNRMIQRLRAPPAEAVAAIAADMEAFREEMGQFCSRFMGPCGDRVFSCGAGEGGVIDSYGRLQPCMFVRDPGLVVDLRITPLGEAFRAIRAKIRDLRSENPGYLERCARCFLHGFCDQCPGRSWSEHGNLDTPVEYLCQVAHEKARCLGLLEEGERGWEVTEWSSRIDQLRSSGPGRDP